MDKINEINKKLRSEARSKQNILSRVETTYEKFKANELNASFDNKTIDDLELFFLYEGKTNDIVVQGTNGKGIAVYVNNKRIELTAGNNINSLEEFDALLKAIRDYYGDKNIKNKINFIEITLDKEQYYRTLLDEYVSSNAKYIYDFFIRLYEEKVNSIKKIENFILMIDEYIKNPSMEKYNYLMNNRPYMNTSNIKELKKELSKYLVVKKNENQELVQALDRKDNKAENYHYVDDDLISLSSKASDELNEIYLFVKSLDKASLKEFASDPLSYFSHIDEEKENIIHNFAIMLNDDEDIMYNKTIIKRLGFKIKG